MREIVVLCGIPLSGKSTYAKEHPEYSVVSRDDIRMKFSSNGRYSGYSHTNENEGKVTMKFNDYYKAEVWLGNSIILDNTHCKPSYIDAEIKRKPSAYTLRVVFFDCPLWKAYLRNAGRWIKTGKFIPFYIIKAMKTNYDKIDKKKYDMVFK